jgi:hypothetical protein
LKEIKLREITGKKIGDERYYTQKQIEQRKNEIVCLNFTGLK